VQQGNLVCQHASCFHHQVRYTKDGKLDGDTNLQLPPITERRVEVSRILLSTRRHCRKDQAESVVPDRHPALQSLAVRLLCSLQCDLSDVDEEYYRYLRVGIQLCLRRPLFQEPALSMSLSW
jgi:hypothetical protein